MGGDKMHRIIEKSRRGESLGEALAAVLITALGALVLASMVTISTRTVRKSQTKMDGFYSQKSSLEEQLAGGGTGSSGTVTLQKLTQTGTESDGSLVFSADGAEIAAVGPTKISDRGIRIQSSSGSDALVAYVPQSSGG